MSCIYIRTCENLSRNAQSIYFRSLLAQRKKQESDLYGRLDEISW